MLLWCSELGAASMTRFRDTFRWLAVRHGEHRLTWGTALANLSVLGHIEADWESGQWAVAPTSLVTMPNSGGFALLVGGQPRWLLQSLNDLPQHPDQRVRELADSVIFQDGVPQPNGPSARYVAIEDEAAARELCAALGIQYVGWVADELAGMLPSLPTMLRERPTLLSAAGVEPRRMTSGGHDIWQECDDDTSDGAYEYKRHGPPRYVFRHSGVGFVADKRTVIYAELARTQRWVLRYDPSRRELLAPVRMQLPLPQSRAAVLNSGRLPQLIPADPRGTRTARTGYVRYINIDAPFAYAVANSLEQKLQMIG